MSNRIIRSLTVFAVMFMLAGVSFAQSERVSTALGDKYVVSAKAGGVNLTEGTVTVIRADGTSGVLIKGDWIEVGDVVSTGANSRAEILLNPGSFLRLGSNSAFSFKTIDLDDLTVDVSKGSAILEVFASNDFEVKVNTPKAGFVLIQSGIYRVDIIDAQGALTVLKGRAEVAGQTDAAIKSGRRAVLTDGVASIAKFKSGDPDGLEAWSKSRSKELTKISTSLTANTLRPTLMRSFLGNGWNMYDSFGLWVFDPIRGFNCFLPFGSGWGSPYGYYYGYGIWRFRLPPVIYQPPVTITPNPPVGPNPYGTRDQQRRTTSPTPSGNQTKVAASPTGARTRGNSAPPFRKMENDNRGSRVVSPQIFDAPMDVQRPRAPMSAPAQVDLPVKTDPTGARRP